MLRHLRKGEQVVELREQYFLLAVPELRVGVDVLEKDGDSQTWENVLQSSDEHFVIDGQKTIYLNPVSVISLSIRTFLIKWEVIPFVLLLGGRLRGFAVMIFFCNVC